ncbi:MAG: polysaccharide deacetylase family protein [bacterium]
MNGFYKFKCRIKRFVVPVLFRSGYYSWLLRKGGNTSRCLILMYHRVGGDEDKSLYGISKQNFERQMQFLREHMRPIPLSFLVDRLQNRSPIPPKSVVVTFDDGYADNYFNAYPVLRKYRIPATIFLVAGYISTGKRFWWDQLRAVVQRNPNLPTVLEKDCFLPPRVLARWLSGGPHSYQELAESLIAHIWRNQNTCPDHWIELLGRGLEKDLSTDDYAPLTWEQVKEMSHHDLEFGSHTVSHPNMVHLPSEEVEDELRMSKKIIEKHLGCPVEGFAYPIGQCEHYDNRIKTLVHKVGFQYACTAQFGCIYPENWDILSLRRIPPPNSLPCFVRDIGYYLSLPPLDGSVR